MKEDATVFQYDEVYDKMEEDKGAEAKKKEAQKKDDKNPKYRIPLPLVPHPPTQHAHHRHPPVQWSYPCWLGSQAAPARLLGSI